MRFDEAHLLGIPRSRRIIAIFDPKHDKVSSVSPPPSRQDRKKSVSLIHFAIVVRV